MFKEYLPLICIPLNFIYRFCVGFTIAVLFGTQMWAAAPEPPISLTIRPVSNSEIKLMWFDGTGGDGVTRYRIQRKLNGSTDPMATIHETAANVVTYTDVGLAGNTNYQYRISAFNGDGVSAWVWTQHTTEMDPVSPPQAVRLITATPVASDAIEVWWVDVDHTEDAYRLQRDANDDNWSDLAVLGRNATFFRDTDLVAGQTYRYRVRGENSIGEAAYVISDPATTKSAPTGPPPAPASLTATVLGDTQIRLEWAAVSGHDGYEIERKPVGGAFALLRTSEENLTVLTDKGLSEQQDYVYRVRAFNSAGASAWIESTPATTTSGSLPLFNVEPNLQYGPDGLRDWAQVDLKIEQLLDNQADWQSVIDATDEFSLNTTVTRVMSDTNKLRMIQFMADNGMTYMLGTGGLRFIDEGPRAGLGVRNAITDWEDTLQPYLALGGTVDSILMDTPFNHVIRGGRYDDNGLDAMDFSISEAAYELAAYIHQLQSYPGLENVRFILCENSGRWSFTDAWPGIDPAMSAGDDGLLYAFEELNRACAHLGVEFDAFIPDANTSYIDGFGPEGFSYAKLKAIEAHVRKYGWDFEKFYNGDSDVAGSSDQIYHEQTIDLFRKMDAAGVVVDVLRSISFTGRPLALLPEDSDYTLMNNAKVLHQALQSTQQGVYTWSGRGVGDAWSEPFNWAGTLAPEGGLTDTLIFDGLAGVSADNDLPAGTPFQTITLGAGLTGDFVLQGNRLQLGDSGGATRIIDMAVGIGASSVTIHNDIDIFEGIGQFVCRVPTTFHGKMTRASGQGANTTLWHDFSGGGTVTLTNEASDFERGLSATGNATVRTDMLADAGLPSPVGAGLFFKLGNAGAPGTLEYTGSATATDRQLRVGGGVNNAGFTGGARFLNNGSGPIDFTAAPFNLVEAGVSAPRTLELGGSYADVSLPNRIRGSTVDLDTAKGGVLSVNISGGTWAFEGENTYTGGTTVAAGASLNLLTGATLAGPVAVAGTLQGGQFNNGLEVQTGGQLILRVDASGLPTPVSGAGALSLANGSGIALDLGGFAPTGATELSLLSGWSSITADPANVAIAVSGVPATHTVDTGSLLGTGTVTLRPRASGVLTIGSGGTLMRSGQPEAFFAAGLNYAPLDDGGHATFNPNSYDSSAASAALQRMADYGFTVARVFINPDHTHPSGIGYNTSAEVPLNPDYLDNVADFLVRAGDAGILVQVSTTHFPRNDKYNALINAETTPAMVEGMNLHYLHPGFIDAKEAYLIDFWTALRDRFPDIEAALFNVDLGNELNFHVLEPFTLESGTFLAANGQSYDLASDRVALADGMAVYWLNRMTAAVRAVLPTSLVNANVFSYEAVKRSGPGDFLVAEAAWRNRFPFRPLAIAQSEVDIVDIHLYGNGMANTTADLDSIEWAATRAMGIANQKAFIVGEFGAMHANFPADQPLVAADFVVELADRIMDEGFVGWMLWTYDGAAFNHHYASERNFFLLDALSRRIPGFAAPLLLERFDGWDFAAKGWTVASGTWELEDSQAIQSSEPALSQIHRGSETFSDFEATLRLRIDSGTGWAGIHFRKGSPALAPWQANGGYLLSITPSGTVSLQVKPLDGTALQTLASAITGLDPTAEWLELGLFAQGSTLRVYANGVELFSINDGSYAEGALSLSMNSLTARMESFTVESRPTAYTLWAEGYELTGSATDPAADLNGNGFSNYESFLLGVHPTAPGARFEMETMLAMNEAEQGVFTLTFPTLENRLYQIESSLTLLPDSWEEASDVFSGDGTLHTAELPTGGEGRMFYRVSVQLLQTQ